MTSRHGGCLCGRTRYVYDPAGIGWCAHCHCDSCRRATGAPMVTFFAIRTTALRWLGSRPSTRDSSPGVTRGFCPECGTPMTYARQSDPDEVHVLAGTLDDPAEVTPTRHDFWDEKLPWLELADDLERHRGSDPD
ncbi:Uncharacterized conserved protein [Tranquillimonas rosea]|uniref:Uncharacterized conserved protein n=1 Tax=Tranquillimonas rosea TaxID=641238 RepID=A0A1H9WDH3_9RHOB|nr:GFA family protein [Tranquillimonas rosea]SES31727.1 Uncharacterized conserved protein [Tranquillimonas rosea]